MGVLHAIQRQKEPMLGALLRLKREQVVERQEAAFPHQRQRALVCVGAGHPRELVAGFHGYTHAGLAAQAG